MKIIKTITFFLLFFTLWSCRKKEFMPEAEGQPVPHEDIKTTIKEALAASPYTLFKAAWERSNMDRLIKEKGNKFPYSLLVPTDAAFIADGITLEVIKNTTPALLDSLLLYHALSGSLNAEDLKSRGENFKVRSLLENPYLKVKPFVSGAAIFDAYAYLQYLKVANGELFINGKKAGTNVPVQTKDGVLWPVNRILHKPVKTIMQALQEDGRFGMYLELNARNDALYGELAMGALSHDFTFGLKVEPASSYNILFNSVFAIPDDVFHQAGFSTVDEVMALNDRNPVPYFDWDTYSMVGGLATDTLIAYHRWGTMFSYNDPNTGRGQENATNFYSNDLNNTLLANYMLVNAGYSGLLPEYKMPLDFNTADGTVKVKVKGADHAAATLLESDINTIMGPIHVVDHFILPRNFKLK